MSKCLECKWFNPQCNDCNKDDHYTYKDDEACDKFEKRKECEYRYENCDCNGCSIICHQYPSECGCDFYYQCKLDNYYCDENCEKHEIRKKLEDIKKEKSDLYDAKYTIEKILDKYNIKIEELEKKLETFKNENKN